MKKKKKELRTKNKQHHKEIVDHRDFVMTH